MAKSLKILWNRVQIRIKHPKVSTKQDIIRHIKKGDFRTQNQTIGGNNEKTTDPSIWRKPLPLGVYTYSMGSPLCVCPAGIVCFLEWKNPINFLDEFLFFGMPYSINSTQFFSRGTNHSKNLKNIEINTELET